MKALNNENVIRSRDVIVHNKSGYSHSQNIMVQVQGRNFALLVAEHEYTCFDVINKLQTQYTPCYGVPLKQKIISYNIIIL